jgi:DNA-binding transcriptional regulator YiaG
LFAFDPKRQAVIILAGSKQGDKRWYDTNIPIAEKLFAEHLEKQRKADEEKAHKEKGKMITHDDYMKKLSPERSEKILAMTKELIAEEKSLRQIRKAREFSQVTLGEILNMKQGDLSKFERRTDAYLSTIRRYVEAMGGTLDLIATFPDTGPVKIVNTGDLDPAETEEHVL